MIARFVFRFSKDDWLGGRELEWLFIGWAAFVLSVSLLSIWHILPLLATPGVSANPTLLVAVILPIVPGIAALYGSILQSRLCFLYLLGFTLANELLLPTSTAMLQTVDSLANFQHLFASWKLIWFAAIASLFIFLFKKRPVENHYSFGVFLFDKAKDIAFFSVACLLSVFLQLHALKSLLLLL